MRRWKSQGVCWQRHSLRQVRRRPISVSSRHGHVLQVPQRKVPASYWCGCMHRVCKRNVQCYDGSSQVCGVWTGHAWLNATLVHGPTMHCRCFINRRENQNHSFMPRAGLGLSSSVFHSYRLIRRAVVGFGGVPHPWTSADKCVSVRVRVSLSLSLSLTHRRRRRQGPHAFRTVRMLTFVRFAGMLSLHTPHRGILGHELFLFEPMRSHTRSHTRPTDHM